MLFFALLQIFTLPRARNSLISNITPHDSSQKCIMCQYLASMIEDELEDGQVQDEIISTLEEYCSLISIAKDTCDLIVESFVPLIIDLLEAEVDPHGACVFIKFCKN